MKCPYCGKVKTAQSAGEYECAGCRRTFVILPDGKITLLKDCASSEKAEATAVSVKRDKVHAEIQIPSLTKILFTDPLCKHLGFATLFLWGIILFNFIITGVFFWDEDKYVIITIGLITIIAIIVFFVRSKKILSAFRFGKRIMARILQIYNIKGRHLEVKYELYGMEYVRILMFNFSDSDYQIGDEIEIIVDKNNPKNVVIFDPYRQ